MLTLKPLLPSLPPTPPAPKQALKPAEDVAASFNRTFRDANRTADGDATQAVAEADPPQEDDAIEETDAAEETADTAVVDEQPDDTDAAQPEIATELVVVVTPRPPAQTDAQPAPPVEAEAETDDIEAAALSAQDDEPPATQQTPAVATVRDGETSSHRHVASQPGHAQGSAVQSVDAAALATPVAKPVAPGPAPVVVAQIEQAVQQLEQGGEVDPNVARVARGLQSALAERGGAVTLRLQPPELGVVRIDVDIRDGVVRATFQTETESVRTMLSHQIGRLRHALEGHGLVVERLEVHTPSSQSAMQQQLARDDAEAEARSRGRREGGGSNRRRGAQQEGQSRFEQTLRGRVVEG